MSTRSRERPGEFPLDVRLEVLKRKICVECGAEYDPDDPFHVHHRIFIASEAARQFPLELIRSIANAALMHRSCHYSYHNLFDEPPQSEVDAVVELYTKLIEAQKREFERARARLGASGSRRLG